MLNRNPFTGTSLTRKSVSRSSSTFGPAGPYDDDRSGNHESPLNDLPSCHRLTDATVKHSGRFERANGDSSYRMLRSIRTKADPTSGSLYAGNHLVASGVTGATPELIRDPN